MVISRLLSLSSLLSVSIQTMSKESSMSLAHVLWGVTGVAGLISMSEQPLPLVSLAMDSFCTSSQVSRAALKTSSTYPMSEAARKKVLTIVLDTPVWHFKPHSMWWAVWDRSPYLQFGVVWSSEALNSAIPCSARQRSNTDWSPGLSLGLALGRVFSL